MIGAAGGVGTATLALLERHALGRRLIEGSSELLLLDRDEAATPLPSRLAAKARWLPPRSIASRGDLDALLDEHAVDELIELAALGTWDCVEACSERGCSYLNTCYDHWDASPPVPAMLRARELFEPPEIAAGVHVIGAGMNPGLVNLLVAAGLDALAERSRRRPSLAALDVHAIVCTELDTTCEPGRDASEHDEFASTWRPEHCLEELLESDAMIVDDGELVMLGHAPHRARYEARCGDRTIVGAMVPHEELVTLAAMYPGVELGYVYALPDAAWQALAHHPERRPEDWPLRRLYPPFVAQLSGADRIGVLLCSRTLGELWIGWHTDVADALALGTNATLLQVATGLACGWTALRTSEPGVWLPEELDGRPLLRAACSVLGELDIVWTPDAPARRLRDRRVE